MIEARWLYDPEAVSWNPNLFVKNALGDVKQEIISECVNNFDEPVYRDNRHHDIAYVWEIRKVMGTFWEKLELNSFPVDVQQLSLQIVAGCPIEECVLTENRQQPSLVNREAFLGRIETNRWSVPVNVYPSLSLSQLNRNGFSTNISKRDRRSLRKNSAFDPSVNPRILVSLSSRDAFSL